jgi:hypothetical protein
MDTFENAGAAAADLVVETFMGLQEYSSTD